MATKQESVWRGTFGAEYTERCTFASVETSMSYILQDMAFLVRNCGTMAWTSPGQLGS